jgi:plastocyanin
MTPRRRIASLITLAAAVTFSAGCGGGYDSPARTPAQPGSTSHSSASADVKGEVKIDDFKFVPADFAVKKGANVTVTNDDSTTHTATADDGSSFDTGDLNSGSSLTISVSKAGSYPYHCSIHPFMHGTLLVK